MYKLRTIIAIAAMALAATAFAQSQDTCPKKQKSCSPYYFVSLQAGGSTTFDGVNGLSDVVSPAYGVSVGGIFTDIIGARVNVTGYACNNRLKSIDEYYQFNYVNSNLDVMVNLYKLCARKSAINESFNVYLLGGLGLCYAWDNDEFAALQNKYVSKITEDTGNAWGTMGSKRKSIFSHSVRAGLMLDFKVSRKINVGVEGTISNFNDRFNSLNGGGSDWMVMGAGYVSYKFGCKKACKASCPKK